MTDEHRLRAFEVLCGQRAPRASDGRGVQALYRCPSCQRVWLQDGQAALLEMDAEHIRRVAREVAADLTALPAGTCRRCLWRQGGGSVEIDEYDQGESFGFCWEIPHPVVVHATSALLSSRVSAASLPDVLTQRKRLRAVLQAAHQALPPRQIQQIPRLLCRLQEATLRPGFGQPGTQGWRWQGWRFLLPCPPLDERRAVVTLLLALPPAEPLSPGQVFRTWQLLLRLTLWAALPADASPPTAPDPHL